jgi:hypothetical protein
MKLWLSKKSQSLIEKYFYNDLLRDQLYDALNMLPEEMKSRMGGSEEYWKEKFNSPKSEINQMHLVENGLRWIIKKSDYRSKRDKKPIEEYLMISIVHGSLYEWLSWHIKAMGLITLQSRELGSQPLYGGSPSSR